MNNIVMTLLLAAQILSALTMVGLILLQHGKGADMGAAFGSGASGSLFGASGSANFLSRSTSVLAAVFFVSTLLLAMFSGIRPTASSVGSVLESAPVSAPASVAASAPVVPASVAVPGAAAAASAVAPAASAAAPAASGAAAIPGQ